MSQLHSASCARQVHVLLLHRSRVSLTVLLVCTTLVFLGTQLTPPPLLSEQGPAGKQQTHNNMMMGNSTGGGMMMMMMVCAD